MRPPLYGPLGISAYLKTKVINYIKNAEPYWVVGHDLYNLESNFDDIVLEWQPF